MKYAMAPPAFCPPVFPFLRVYVGGLKTKGPQKKPSVLGHLKPRSFLKQAGATDDVTELGHEKRR